jgi:hypothetical protein
MNPGRQAYSSSLYSLSYPDPVCKTSRHFTPLHFHFTSLLSPYFTSLIFTFLTLFLHVWSSGL